jgi:transposase
MHVYYDQELAVRQKKRIFEEIKSHESDLIQLKRLSKQDAKRHRSFFKIALEADGSFVYERDNDKIEAKADDCGFYCLPANTGLDATQTLAKYRRKDAIEKGFEDVKNQVKMKRLRTRNAETTDGKLFCAFIAPIVASEMGEKLGEFMREKCWSKSRVITEMEKIRVVLAANGKRLMNTVTKTQRTMLDKFGLTEDDLKAYVTCS